jgi:hypothetical protein
MPLPLTPLTDGFAFPPSMTVVSDPLDVSPWRIATWSVAAAERGRVTLTATAAAPAAAAVVRIERRLRMDVPGSLDMGRS